MERKHKNIIMPTAIVVATVLIAIGGFIVLNSNNPHSNPSGNEQKESNESPLFIENTTNKPISEGHLSTLRELNKTSNPKFKVGEKYFYHRWSKRPDSKRPDGKDVIFLPEEYDTVVEVEKIERMNKINYYVLKSSNASVYSEILVYKDGVWKKEPLITRTATVEISEGENRTKEKSVSISETKASGVKVYEGGIVRVGEHVGMIQTDPNSKIFSPVLSTMFATWMLYLNEGVSWIEKYNVSNSMIGKIMSEKE